MKKIWKITNTSNIPIKIAVAISSNQAPGIILQPGQFCLSLDQMTTPLDKQHKTNFVSIEEDFENIQNLDLAKAYDSTKFNEIQKEVKKYVN